MGSSVQQRQASVGPLLRFFPPSQLRLDPGQDVPDFHQRLVRRSRGLRCHCRLTPAGLGVNHPLALCQHGIPEVLRVNHPDQVALGPGILAGPSRSLHLQTPEAIVPHQRAVMQPHIGDTVQWNGGLFSEEHPHLDFQCLVRQPCRHPPHVFRPVPEADKEPERDEQDTHP